MGEKISKSFLSWGKLHIFLYQLDYGRVVLPGFLAAIRSNDTGQAGKAVATDSAQTSLARQTRRSRQRYGERRWAVTAHSRRTVATVGSWPGGSGKARGPGRSAC